MLGIASLVGFALSLTRVDSAFAGRAYAAYGGIYIAASLAWLWAVERQAPTKADVSGAALAIAGALMIIGFAARVEPHFSAHRSPPYHVGRPRHRYEEQHSTGEQHVVCLHLQKRRRRAADEAPDNRNR